MLAAGVALSVGIEFTQIFFPPRTVSINDIIAESMGTVIGIVGWWAFGARLSRWYVDWRRIKEPATFAERLAWAYVAAVYIYGVLPLDLTISAVEIFHKWREGKLILIPFAGLPPEPSLALFNVTMDALMWAPPAFFWQISGKRSSLRVWVMTIGGATLLEVLQLFVYSRVTDVTEVITAALGGAAGVLLGAKYVASLRPGVEIKGTTATSDIIKTLLPLALALSWMIGLAVLFWYPFHFRTDGAFLRERLHGFMTRVPFEAYYYGTEYRAATEVLHKVLFFIPLGCHPGLVCLSTEMDVAWVCDIPVPAIDRMHGFGHCRGAARSAGKKPGQHGHRSAMAGRRLGFCHYQNHSFPQVAGREIRKGCVIFEWGAAHPVHTASDAGERRQGMMMPSAKELTMRDIAILVILLALAWLAWRKPWTGVVGLGALGRDAPPKLRR